MRHTLSTMLWAFSVSIHASVKDATNRARHISGWHGSFNPRICKRCDSRYNEILSFTVVSIHASVKDATWGFNGSGRLYGFNPRICKRCDLYHIRGAHFQKRFNPRICKRCDWRFYLYSKQAWSFNPRICKRCDENHLTIILKACPFQSTHL